MLKRILGLLTVLLVFSTIVCSAKEHWIKADADENGTYYVEKESVHNLKDNDGPYLSLCLKHEISTAGINNMVKPLKQRENNVPPWLYSIKYIISNQYIRRSTETHATVTWFAYDKNNKIIYKEQNKPKWQKFSVNSAFYKIAKTAENISAQHKGVSRKSESD